MGVVLPDAPHTAKWLTRREKVIVVSRKRHDYHNVDRRQFKLDQFIETLKDPKTYLYFLLGAFANIPNGGSQCLLVHEADAN